MTKIPLFFSSALSLAALSGCNLFNKDIEEPSSAKLHQFEDCQGVQSYIGEAMLNQILSAYYPYWHEGMMFSDAEADSGSEPSSNSSESPSDFSTTNVQEEGVDEMDMVKTDGNFIYYAQQNRLHIVDSWPAEEANKVASVKLDGHARGLFLNGDKLVVMSYFNSATRLQVYDVSDRTNPIVLRSLDIEGYIADARMIESDVYLALNNYLNLPQSIWQVVQDNREQLPDMSWGDNEESHNARVDALRAEARDVLKPIVDDLAANMSVDDVLPEWTENGVSQPLHSCTDLMRPNHAQQLSILSLVNIDLDDGSFNSAGLMSNGWTVYASQKNLYVAQSGRWWWGWGDTGMNSHIHKFDLNDGGAPHYVASGEVNGWIYDQFAMSEYDGHLRVASTEMNWWVWDEEDQGGNNITVLKDNRIGDLETVGEVTGLAPGERIYASRMFGSKGYIVTFRQIDPLFTVDLSDPSNPTVMGELKIPGYSAYLHPIAEDRLLAVGMDGDMDGNLSGLAVTIFDVSNMEEPTLEHKFSMPSDGWAWSEALWDHHAFTYHNDTLSIPAYTYDWSEDGGYNDFSGLITFDIDIENGITELGRVDHQSLVADSECIYNVWYEDSNYEYNCGWYEWRSRVRRSIVMEDKLFSISDYGVKVNELGNPSEDVAEVLFYPSSQ